MRTWTEDSWDILASLRLFYSGIPPAPLVYSPGGEPDGEGATHEPNTSHHLSLSTHPDQTATAFLPIQNHIRCLPKMLSFMNLKLRVRSQKLKLKVNIKGQVALHL